MSWYRRKIPDNVWTVASYARYALWRAGVDVDPRTLLVPKFCPRCNDGTMEETKELVRCTSCGYARPNIADRGRDLTLGDLAALVGETAHHVVNRTLLQRLHDAWAAR